MRPDCRARFERLSSVLGIGPAIRGARPPAEQAVIRAAVENLLRTLLSTC